MRDKRDIMRMFDGLDDVFCQELIYNAPMTQNVEKGCSLNCIEG